MTNPQPIPIEEALNQLQDKLAELLDSYFPEHRDCECSSCLAFLYGLKEEAGRLIQTHTRLARQEERRKLTYEKLDKSVLESDGLKCHFNFKFHDRCSEEHFAVFGVSDEKWSVAIDGQNIISRLKSDTTLLEGEK